MTRVIKLLLVDDEEDLREGLSDMFAMHGEFMVVGCSSGAEALKEVKAHNYDGIILDIGLPDIDGR